MNEQLLLLPERLSAHLELTLVALFVGVAVAVPLGIAVTRRASLEPGVLGVASVIQTIPSLALLAIMVPALASLAVVLGRFGVELRSIGYAPAIVALVGGTVEEAIDFSRQMREITLGENPNVTIPLLGFMGVPSAIDITRVGSSGILPVINTAIAHKDAGIGMIGAGIVHPPFACFEKAILGWCERYGV